MRPASFSIVAQRASGGAWAALRAAVHEFGGGAFWRAYWLAVLLLAAVSGSSALAEPAASTDKPAVLLVIGAAGEEEFGKRFSQWAGLWQKAAERGGAKVVTVGLEQKKESTDRERLKQALAEEPKEGPGELWLVLIGHGTFDGKEAKFNLTGPDLSATELAEGLKPFHRPLAVIDTAAASGPFLSKLSASNRVIITATRSGHEQNYARFGQYLSEAIADPAADLDKDGQTSLLEAFLTAARRTAEFYQVEGRLATEHALLDDNGDGLGTLADWFRGVRAVKRARDGAAVDGVRAHQFHLVRSDAEMELPPIVRVRRDELELEIAGLREKKSQLNEDEYYSHLEVLLLEMAKLYERSNNVQKAAPPAQ